MGFLFLLGSEQRSGDLDKLSNLLFVCDSFKEGSDPISVAEELDLCKPERWPGPEEAVALSDLIEEAVVAIESEGTAHSQWQEQDISRMGCSQRCYISAVRTNPYIRKDASDFSCT